MQPCVYTSETRGIHDERWIAALRAVGFEPAVVVRAPGETDADVRSRVSSHPGPILAGPLDSVTLALEGMPGVIGLSWGFDVPRMSDAQVHRLSWLDGLVVDSLANRDRLVLGGVAPSSITVMPWGIELDRFTPLGPMVTPESLPFAPAVTRFVVSARAHEPLYRVTDVADAFIRVAPRHPDLGLVFAHGGSLTSTLQALAEAGGVADRVAFIGTVPEDEIAPLLRGAAAYVTASEVDGTSVTLLQAMACGVPIVASDNAGNRGWITQGLTGWTFPTGDAEALATALESALAAPEAAAITSRASALVAEEADWRRNMSRLAAAMGTAARASR